MVAPSALAVYCTESIPSADLQSRPNVFSRRLQDDSALFVRLRIIKMRMNDSKEVTNNAKLLTASVIADFHRRP